MQNGHELKATPFRTSLLIGATLLTAGAVLVVTLVPLAPCKGCLIRNAYEDQLRAEAEDLTIVTQQGKQVIPGKKSVLPARPLCPACHNTGKMPLLRKWLGQGS